MKIALKGEVFCYLANEHNQVHSSRRQVVIMCNTNQDRLGCAAVTSKPQIPMACDKCLLAHRIHPGQVGHGSFRCCLPSKARLDAGGSIPNILSLTAKGNPYAVGLNSEGQWSQSN